MGNKKDMFHWFMWQGVGIFSWFMWISSSFLSYWGFTHLGPTIWWVKVIAGGFAIGINFVEFMLDNMGLDELLTVKSVGDVVLRVFGVVCYAYDIWTNVLGFGLIILGANAALNTFSLASAFSVDPTMAIFAVLFGLGFAIGPEPLYIMFLRENFRMPRKAQVAQNQPKHLPQNYQPPHKQEMVIIPEYLDKLRKPHSFGGGR